MQKQVRLTRAGGRRERPTPTRESRPSKTPERDALRGWGDGDGLAEVIHRAIFDYRFTFVPVIAS